MYETKTIAELEQLANNLRRQITLHPNYRLERAELKECERVIEMRRREFDSARVHCLAKACGA